MSTLTYTDTLSILECGNCHISFAIPRDMLRARQSDGKDFWCPNGCKIHYYETEEQRLKKRLEAEQAKATRLSARLDQAKARADHEEHRARAYKGQVTKIKNRVSKGVCPCCNRSFENLARHMASQHPDYADGG